jgi:hypothetical protein
VTLTPDYTELLKAKDYLNIVDDKDDDFIALFIATSSRAINKSCHRNGFGRLNTPVQLRYRAWYNRGDRLWTANIHDVYSAEGLVVTVDGTPVTEYDLLPDTAAMKGRPWEQIAFRRNAERQPTGAPREVGVLGLPGWAAVPVEVVEACLLQTSRFNARRRSPFGVAGSPQNGGTELRLLERLDPDVAVSLRSVRRMWTVA